MVASVTVCMCVCVVVTYIYSRVCINNRGKIANPARDQLKNGKIDISLSPYAPENLVSRDRFDRPVPRQPAHSPHSG